MKPIINKIPTISIYEGLEDDIKNIKTKIFDKIKIRFKDMGCELIASWMNWNSPVLYGDIFLIRYKEDKMLYSFSFSSGMKQIIVNGYTYQRFDTVKFSNGRRELYGYRIKSNSLSLERYTDKTVSNFSKDMIYQDHFRKNKVKYLLKQNDDN